jgi:hypothetical protein
MLTFLWVVLIGGTAMAYEEPSYTTVIQNNHLSIRNYPATLRAEVTVPDSTNWKNETFMVLANYIFGKTAVNNEKIGMTVPVNMAEPQPDPIGMTIPVHVAMDKNFTMTFYMPSRYTSATLPKPTDPRIRIVEAPAETLAVAQFSWWFTDTKFEDYRDELMAWLPTQGYKPTGLATRNYYNQPWSLPWLRRNEVWVPVVKVK